MFGLWSRYCLTAVFLFCLGCYSSLNAAESVPNGSLLVKVIPRGAEVLINDQVVGMAPVIINNIRPGRVRVQARLPGYRPWGKSLTVLDTEKNVVTLILARSVRGGVN
jgi:hypothetical protein